MDQDTVFTAMWVEENPGGEVSRRLIQRRIAELPPGNLLVRVQYSSLNYKDALSASGNHGVTRHYPHTPGIDAAGVVVESGSSDFKPGQPVVVMDFDLGANIPGGFGQYIRVPAKWAMPQPAALNLEESVAFGTAGLTAALSVDHLLSMGCAPGKGDALVTGATGGVGVFAVAILAKQGFHVVAMTGKPDKAAFLKDLGAAEIISRDQGDDTSEKPLLHARWAAVVDTIGGNYLATALRSTLPGGSVTTCGNVASPELHLTVFPFILRGVNLLGMDVSQLEMPYRRTLWTKMAGVWKPGDLARLYRVVPLQDLEDEIQRILQGGQSGRVVIKI